MLKETQGYSWIRYFFKLFTEAEMAYNTFLFLVFLILFLCVYFLLRGPRMRRNWILVGNLVFYAWAGLGELCFILGTSVITYVLSRIIERIYASFDGEGLSPKEKRTAFAAYEKRARVWMVLGLIVIIGIWAGVKIGKLAGMSSGGMQDLLSGKAIIVPLGISYYTLCMAAYVMDIYWQKTCAEHNLLKLMAASTYFPCIVQGPFVRYQKIMDQFDELSGFDYDRVCRGLQRSLWGYLKKLVIADRLSILTGTIFADPASYAGIEIIFAVLLGAVQLYADFSGCMDIILGISEVIGIQLPENFRQPFFAKSAAEFWRRWHISLGEWTKEYIYLPIAMNGKFLKKGRAVKKTYGRLAAKIFSSFFPLFAVWLFTGLWHGTGLDYICWGMYWGLIIILGQMTEEVMPKVCTFLHIDTTRTWHQCWRMLRTFLIFCIGRMWTVVGGVSGFMLLWKQIFAEHRLWILTDGTLYTYGLTAYDYGVALTGIAAMWIVDLLHERGFRIRERIAALPIVIRWAVYLAAIGALLIFGQYGPGYDAESFVYGNF